MRTAVVVLALLAFSAFAYDFSKPANGNELMATLKDEKNTTFVVFFHATAYEGDDDEAKKIQETVKDMKEDVQKNCTNEGLKDNDYTYIEVEIELDGTTEKDQENAFGNLLLDLGFEEKSSDTAADTTTARRNLQETEETSTDGASSGSEPVDLPKLQKAPYALVMRNQQGYRVSGNNISTELCYQAKQYKKLAEKQAKASK